MFYTQFLKTIESVDVDFIKHFDYWLATLPIQNQKNITASVVSARLGSGYEQADKILRFACREGILHKYYLIKCPSCDYNIGTIEESEIADSLINLHFCCECDDDVRITTDDIYTAYRVVQKPDADEKKIRQAIESKLKEGLEHTSNFTIADSLSNEPQALFQAFYNPSESAYTKFCELRGKLDLDYGENTTAKGRALESLVIEIFNEIKYVQGTTDIKTQTNQFDCTFLCNIKTVKPTVFSYLSPYFIIECKNEKKKPDNNYTNKLESILSTNDAQIGIVFGRKDATSTCFSISREHYLSNKHSSKQQIIFTCSDVDLDYIIEQKVNLLNYLEFKIFQITSNSPNSKFESFQSGS